MNTSMTAAVMPTTGAQSMILLIGRILIALLFLVIGLRKVFVYAGTVQFFTKLGFPAPEVMTWLAIIIEVGGGLMLLVGWRARWAAWLLALFVVIATIAAHRFWEVDAAQFVNQLNHFWKNVAIIGGLLFVAVFGPGGASVDKR